MPFHFKGQEFEAVAREKMTPGEIDAVERYTGYTYKRISFMANRCVCEHPAQSHLHYEATNDGDARLDANNQSCGEDKCPCLAFDPDLPALIQYAFLYVAAKRADPGTSWDEIRDLPQDAWTYTRSEAENPTQPSDSEE